MTTERKYVLTKLAEGDYAFPSNDARVLWRVHRQETGDELLDGWVLWRYTGDIDELDWDWRSFEHFDGPFRTRREAVEAAFND